MSNTSKPKCVQGASSDECQNEAHYSYTSPDGKELFACMHCGQFAHRVATALGIDIKLKEIPKSETK